VTRLWFRHLISLTLFALLLLMAFGSSSDNDSPTTTRRTTTGTDRSGSSGQAPSTGPPVGYDAAGVVVEGISLYVYRMSTHHPDMYRSAQAFTGKGWAFMVLGINAKEATDKFTWHCWTNKVVITLKDGSESKSMDLSDMDGFYSWAYHENFACTKTVYPGKAEFHYLAFYPSFSWKNVRQVTFQTGALGMGIRKARWMKIN